MLVELAFVPVFDVFGVELGDIDERTPEKLIKICSN